MIIIPVTNIFIKINGSSAYFRAQDTYIHLIKIKVLADALKIELIFHKYETIEKLYSTYQLVDVLLILNI